MNSSTGGYDYSTLEVNPHQTPDVASSQLPEVNHNANPDLNYPEVAPHDGLHTGYQEIKTDQPPAAAPTDPRICGIRRKFFWMGVIVAVLVVAGIVAGVVGGVVASRSSSTSDGADQSNSTTGTDTGIKLLANTQLASANFTDQYGNDNYLLVYQLSDRSIRMSAWNSSFGEWVVSSVVDGGDDVARVGSALSLDVFRKNDKRRHVRLYWQLPQSGGYTTINSLIYRAENNISTDAVAPIDTWEEALGGTILASQAGSGIVSYGRQCANCNQYSYFYWQASDGIRLAHNTDGTWISDGVMDVEASPSANTSLAQAHSAAATTDGYRSMNLFYRSTTSALTQLQNGYSQNHSTALGRDIGPDTAIAAFSTGFNETSSGWSDPLGFQVLTIDPDVDDGVQLTYYKGSSWTAMTEEVEALSECRPKAMITANPGRRIYCVTEDGDDVQIIEFAWKGDPSDTGTYADWERIGPVDTALTS